MPKALFEHKYFILTLLIALGLRLSGITFESLWLDEAYQSLIDIYQMQLPEVHSATINANTVNAFLFKFNQTCNLSTLIQNFRQFDPLCPPLYAVCLNFWVNIFGGSDFALRVLSLVFSLLAITITYIFSLRLFGIQIAILSSVLLAFSPFDIYYAQEARMYSLVFLMSCLSGLSLLCFLRSKDTVNTVLMLILHSISTWGLINAHYTALFVPAFLGLFCLCFLTKNKEWTKLFSLFGAWTLTALLCLPWLPLFLEASRIRKESFYVARTGNPFWPVKALFSSLPINWLCFLSGKKVVAWAIPIYLTSALMLFMSLVKTFTKSLKEDKSSLLFLWSWALFPALAIWLLDVIELHSVIEVPRYLIASAPPIYILAAIGLSSLNRKVMFMLLFSHIFLCQINNFYHHIIYQKEPWHKMAALIETRVSPKEVIIISPYYNLVCLDRYLKQPYKQVGLEAQLGQDYINSNLSGLDQFWLLTAQEGENIATMIPSDFKLTERYDLCHGLHLRHFQRN